MLHPGKNRHKGPDCGNNAISPAQFLVGRAAEDIGGGSQGHSSSNTPRATRF
jgi:hypothetical protein